MPEDSQQTTPPATNPTPIPDNHNAISAELQASLAQLAHKHVSVSYALIGIIFALFLLMGGAAYVANKFWERDVARAEAAEKRAEAAEQRAAASEKLTEQYRAQSDAMAAKFTDALQKNQALMAKDAQIIATLQQQIKDRDAAASQHKTEVLAKNKTAREAYDDLKTYNKDVKSDFAPGKDAVGNDTLAFLVFDVQNWTALKIDYDTLKADYGDLQKQNETQKHTIDNLTATLDMAKGTIAAQQQTIDQAMKTISDKNAAIAEKDTTIKEYKKAAKVGKWRRIGGAALKVVIFVGGAALGHAL